MTSLHYGSDAIVAMLSQLGVEYAAFNPGASFRGIQDSLVHLEEAPRIIQCTHEEIAVALTHGYAKAVGQPMVACVHDLVGLQHASMAIYNAWCDREPVVVLGGSGPRDAAERRPWIEWIHAAVDQGHIVRDYVKWDDEPGSLAALPESLARAFRVAMTRPCGPTYLSIDVSLQETALPAGYGFPDLRRYAAPPPPAVPTEELERLAADLQEARHPVIVVDRAPRFQPVIALSEALGAPVVDRGNRIGFPTEHPLNLTGADEAVLSAADFVLGLEVEDLFGALHRKRPGHPPAPLAPRAKVAHIGLRDLAPGSWAADYQRLSPVDFPLAGDADEAAGRLAVLMEGRVPAERRDSAVRAARDQHDTVRRAWRDEADRRRGDAPMSSAVIAATIGGHLAGADWCLAHDGTRGWARRLWAIDRPGQYLGRSGGGGIGYALGASIGAALALRDRGTLVVDVQGDGDLLYTPGALWTAAKYDVPLLIVVDNNRSYLNSQEHAEQIALLRGRSAAHAGTGTEIREPDVDITTLARSFGVWAEGPVLTADQLDEALGRATAVVRGGRPALVEVTASR